MSWKKRGVNTDSEKDIITGMIVSDRFLREIQPILKNNLLQLPFAKTIALWCNDYFKKYEKAPQQIIQDIYTSFPEKSYLDDTQHELIGEFLSNLSSRYETNSNFNDSYELDKAEKYLKLRTLEILKEEISGHIAIGDIEEAEHSVSNFVRVERPQSVGIDILKDKQVITDLFFQEKDILFQLPGALGEMIRPFEREDFLAVTAPMKRGKSYWLQEIGIRAMLNHLKVIYFNLEMSESKLLFRIYENLLGEPKRIDNRPIIIPYFDDDNFIETKEINKKGLEWKKVLRKIKAIDNMIKAGRFILVSIPAYSYSVMSIKIHLDNLEHYNKFVPDVVVVDYADILSPEPDSPKDYRHKLDHTWKSLRALAQERKCLVATGSQSVKSTLSKDIGQEDIAEDIRKLAHVTTMISLNQKGQDKKRGIMRVGMLALRDDEFFIDSEVVVLENRRIGKPYLDSRFKKEVKNLI